MRQPFRIPGALAAAAGAALLAAGCGGGGAPAAGAPYTYQQALAYAQCMRSHGDPGFPDPDSRGEFTSTLQNRSALAGPVYQAAGRACRKLAPPAETPAQAHQDFEAAVHYAACMRAAGYPDFPDPAANGTFTTGGIQAADNGADSPQFQAAMRGCNGQTHGGPA